MAMTEEQVKDLLISLSTKLATPVLNTTEADICKLLWKFGFKPASIILKQQGVPPAAIDIAMSFYKSLWEIVEPSDLVVLPDNLERKMLDSYRDEISANPPQELQRLDERVIKEITEFRVEMYGDEARHAGRPHVKVYLQDGAISISLDDPPINLTPKGSMRGLDAALKVIGEFRSLLLDRWHQTRPDTQKLFSRQVAEPATGGKLFELKAGHTLHWLSGGGLIVLDFNNVVHVIDVESPELAIYAVHEQAVAQELLAKSARTRRNRGSSVEFINIDD
jgi:hypothetical protein